MWDRKRRVRRKRSWRTGALWFMARRSMSKGGVRIRRSVPNNPKQKPP